MIENCHLYGLLLLQDNPAKTSIMDSRTSNYGIRATEIQARTFKNKPEIQGRVANALKLDKKGETVSPDDRILLTIHNKIKNLSPIELAKAPSVIILQKDGPFFISSDKESPLPMSGDLNASINIGLRRLTLVNWPSSFSSIEVDVNTVPLKKYEMFSIIPKNKPLIESMNISKRTAINSHHRIILSIDAGFPLVTPLIQVLDG
jgi:hypothetical protein